MRIKYIVRWLIIAVAIMFWILMAAWFLSSCSYYRGDWRYQRGFTQYHVVFP